MLPEDLCVRHGITLDTFFENADDLSDLIHDVAVCALDDGAVDHVFLKSARSLSQIYLKNIKSNQYNVLSEKLKVDPPFKMLRLFWKMKVL